MRKIPGFSKYLVSEDGRIFRFGRELSLWADKDGYLRCSITNDFGERKMIAAHTAVALAFIGLKPSHLHEVCHNDGSRTNNHFSNLRWGTRKENHQDLKKHGTSLIGERNGRAKLTSENVDEIKKTIKQSMGINRVKRGTIIKLAKKFCVHPETIRRASKSKSWR